MSKSLFIAGRNGGANFADGTKRYQNISGTFVNSQVGTSLNRARTLIRDAGTIRNYSIFVVSNAVTDTTLVGIQINGADSTIGVSFTADETGEKFDTTNDDTVAAGDTVNYYIDPPAEAGTNNITPTYSKAEYETDTAGNTLSKWVAAGTTTNIAFASETRYINPSAVINVASTSENNQKIIVQFNAVSQDLFVGAPTNARTTNTIFKTRVDNGDGGQSVTFGSGETGDKEDTTGTDTLSSGKGFNYAVVTDTGTETMNLGHVGTSLVSTDGQFHMLTGDAAAVDVNFNQTRFALPTGTLVFGATEANCTAPTSFEFTAKLLGVLCTANSIATSATTVHIMDDTVATDVTVSYAAAETGTKTDTTNDAVIASDSNFNSRVVTPNTSGTFSVRGIWMTGEISSAPEPQPNPRTSRGLVSSGITR